MRRGPRTITVAGGNLFRIAAERLNDATQWYRIALANNLTDPMIDGVVTLTLPPPDSTGGNGGILGPQ